MRIHNTRQFGIVSPQFIMKYVTAAVLVLGILFFLVMLTSTVMTRDPAFGGVDDGLHLIDPVTNSTIPCLQATASDISTTETLALIGFIGATILTATSPFLVYMLYHKLSEDKPVFGEAIVGIFYTLVTIGVMVVWWIAFSVFNKMGRDIMNVQCDDDFTLTRNMLLWPSILASIAFLHALAIDIILFYVESKSNKKEYAQL